MHKSDGLSRVSAISLNHKTLVTPTYFPAISTVGNKHGVVNLAQLLVDYKFPQFLISAYDLHELKSKERKSVYEMLLRYVDESILFLDSGKFESHWLGDSSWSLKSYRKVTGTAPFDIYTSLDLFQLVNNVSEGIVETAVKRIENSRKSAGLSGFTPIIHGVTPNALVSMVEGILNKLPFDCEMIAVPERDCGRNILEKAITVARIRQKIGDVQGDAILHILGCGNPKSLALFSFCGADTFDSLDWVKHALNPVLNSFEDFSYLDTLSCNCRFCSGKDRLYTERVLLHNLKYYQEFMKEVKAAIRENRFSRFIEERMGSDIALIAERALRECK